MRRIYKHVGPYRGRVRAKMATGGGLLREASRQPDDTVPKGVTLKAGRGDTTDRYLRGFSGGESHPYYDQRKSKK
jgi:hypothetical protein